MNQARNAPVFPDPAIAEQIQKVEIRTTALQAALATNPGPTTTGIVIAAATAYADFLTGTPPAPAA